MKLLFNRDGSPGATEIKKTLGFLDGGFSYENLEPDIILNTPYLIDLVGQAVYDKVVAFYEAGETDNNAELKEALASALTFMRLYILSMAYLDYAADNDLNHTTAGRVFRSEENDKIPWDWQIQKSDASLKKRAYKALDQLFILLNIKKWSEWTDSDPYKASQKLFIRTTSEFDAVFPINKSGQLYHRLVPFMADIENDRIAPVLTQSVYDALRAKEEPTDQEKKMIGYIRKAVAYLSLGRALKAFPVEMFPEGLQYQENTRMKSEARAEVMQFLNTEGENYILKLEYENSRKNATYEALDPLQGLDENSKHVSL